MQFIIGIYCWQESLSLFLLPDLLDLSILIATGLRNIAIPDMNIVADTYQKEARQSPVASLSIPIKKFTLN